MRWTIKRKLALFFTVIVLLMGVAGYSGIYALSQLDAGTKEILQTQQPILTHISDIKSDLLHSRLKLSQYIATGNKAHLQEINTIINNVNESLSFLESKTFTEEETGLLDNIERAFDSYRNFIYNIISFYEKSPGDTETITRKKQMINSLLENALLIKLNSLHDIEEEKAEELGELGHDLYFQSFWTIVFFSTILIMVGGLVFFSISRRIANPLVKMAKAIPKIAGGEFSQTLHIKSDDEIGELATAFNKMTMDLKRSRKELEKHSEGLEKEVMIRTKELKSKVEQLEKFNKFSVGRELRMIELKKRIKELEGET